MNIEGKQPWIMSYDGLMPLAYAEEHNVEGDLTDEGWCVGDTVVCKYGAYGMRQGDEAKVTKVTYIYPTAYLSLEGREYDTMYATEFRLK